MPEDTKPKYQPYISCRPRVMDMDRLNYRELAEHLKNQNPETAAKEVDEMFENRNLKIEQIPDLRDFREILSQVSLDIPNPDAKSGKRTITSNAFQIITGNSIYNQIQAAYEALPDITGELVTESTDNKKDTKYVRLKVYDNSVQELGETEEAPEISAGEEYCMIGSKRNGRSIKISENMIQENDIADIVNRCNKIGEFNRWFITDLTIKRITDYWKSPTDTSKDISVYRPSGVGAAMYSSTANTPGTRAPSGNRVINNPLASEANLQAAADRFATFVDENGRKIAFNVNRMILLVPYAKSVTAWRITASVDVPGLTDQLNPWGPQGIFKPRLVVCPWLDIYDANTWYLGEFSKQFTRKTKKQMDIVTLSGTGTEIYARNSIAFYARSIFEIEVGALDYIYVVQNLMDTNYTPSGRS